MIHQRYEYETFGAGHHPLAERGHAALAYASKGQLR